MSPSKARRALFVLFLVNAVNIYDRQALGAVVEPLRREFHLSDAQLGALPTAFVLLYALAGVPLGRVVDRASRRRLLAAACALWGGLTAAGGVAASYSLLLVTRLGVGVGEAVCAPAAASWIGDLVPPARRARAMAGFMLAVPVGVMASFAITGPVAEAYGWRMALALAAAPAVLLVPAVLLLEEPARPAGKLAFTDPAPLRLLLGQRTLWWISVSGALANFLLYSFSYFLAAFLTRFHGLSIARAGLWSGLGSGAAGIAGGLAVFTLGDRTRDGGRLRLAGTAALVAAPLAAAAIALPHGHAAWAVVLLMTAYGLWQMYYGLTYAAIQDVVGPPLRGTAMALYFLIMYLAGGAFGPLALGALSDRLAGGTGEAARASGLHRAMYAIPALSLLLAIVLGRAAASIRAAGEPPGRAD